MVLELVEDYVTLENVFIHGYHNDFHFMNVGMVIHTIIHPIMKIFKDKNEPLKSEPSTVRDLTSSPLIFESI